MSVRFQINEARIVRGRFNSIGVHFMDKDKNVLETCGHSDAIIHLENEDGSTLQVPRVNNVQWGEGHRNVVSTSQIDSVESAALEKKSKADLKLEIVFPSLSIKKRILGYLTVVDPEF